MSVWLLASRQRKLPGVIGKLPGISSPHPAANSAGPRSQLVNASTDQSQRPFPKPLRNWLQRHRHPFNFWIHMLGIPLAVAGLVWLIVRWDEWYWGVAGLVLGYALQWLGHTIEGNDVGEWAGIKRLLGLPYVGISPRWQDRPEQASKVSG
jgi:hypothetical protein